MLKEGPLGYMHILSKPEATLPFPVGKHTAESRWQSCDCETCQKKRIMMDSLPGKTFDWDRYKRTTDWPYGAIFYLND